MAGAAHGAERERSRQGSVSIVLPLKDWLALGMQLERPLRFRQQRCFISAVCPLRAQCAFQWFSFNIPLYLFLFGKKRSKNPFVLFANESMFCKARRTSCNLYRTAPTPSASAPSPPLRDHSCNPLHSSDVSSPSGSLKAMVF